MPKEISEKGKPARTRDALYSYCADCLPGIAAAIPTFSEITFGNQYKYSACAKVRRLNTGAIRPLRDGVIASAARRILTTEGTGWDLDFKNVRLFGRISSVAPEIVKPVQPVSPFVAINFH